MFGFKKSNDAGKTAGYGGEKSAPEPVKPATPPADDKKPVPPSPSPSGAAATQISPEEAKKRAMVAKMAAASFGEIVSLLMRSPGHQNMALKDLQTLVAPAILTGQFAVADAQSKENGSVMPVGAVIWAHVSPEVDKRLSENLNEPVQLALQEWRSGDIPWIILSLGDKGVVGSLLQQLTANIFKAKAPKLRVRGADGAVSVGRLELAAQKSN